MLPLVCARLRNWHAKLMNGGYGDSTPGAFTKNIRRPEYLTRPLPETHVGGREAHDIILTECGWAGANYKLRRPPV